MSLHSLLLLAQAAPPANDLETLRKTVKPTGPILSPEVAIILGCALALSAILFIWAFFVRKRPKTMRGALVVERARKGSSTSEDGSKRRRRKRRPDHPENWGRNPTLGETGGLPPERSDEPGSDGPDQPAASNDDPQPVRPR